MDDQCRLKGEEPRQHQEPWNKVPDLIARALGGIERIIAATFGSAFAVAVLVFTIVIGTSIFYGILRILLRYAFDTEIENPFDGWQYVVPEL